MGTPRLPGPWVITALMLAAAIIAAISITGPIPVRYDAIRDFQPLIAAAVALCAAALAYYAAQMKVNFDRSVHEAAELRRKTNLLRKLYYAVRMSCTEVRAVRVQVVPDIGLSVNGITRATFELALPKEFEEALEQIDILTMPILEVLTVARYQFKTVSKERAAMDETATWAYNWSAPSPPAEIAKAVDAIRELERYLEGLTRLLASS